jgi:hypothetical protein
MSLCFSYEFQNDVIFGLCAIVTTLNWPNNIGDKLNKKINEIIFPAVPLFKWHCILYLF